MVLNLKLEAYLEELKRSRNEVTSKLAYLSDLLDIIFILVNYLHKNNLKLPELNILKTQKINLDKIMLIKLEETAKSDIKTAIKSLFSQLLVNGEECTEDIDNCDQLYDKKSVNKFIETLNSYDIDLIRHISICGKCSVCSLIKNYQTLNHFLANLNIALEEIKITENSIRFSDFCKDKLIKNICEDPSFIKSLQILKYLAVFSNTFCNSELNFQASKLSIFKNITNVLTNLCESYHQIYNNCVDYASLHSLLDQYNQLFSFIKSSIGNLKMFLKTIGINIEYDLNRIQDLIQEFQSFRFTSDHVPRLIGLLSAIDQQLYERLKYNLSERQLDLLNRLVALGSLNIAELNENELMELYGLCKKRLIRCEVGL
jgi:glutaredoxin-related protein